MIYDALGNFDPECNHFLTLINDRELYEKMTRKINYAVRREYSRSVVARTLFLSSEFKRLNLAFLVTEDYIELKKALVNYYWPPESGKYDIHSYEVEETKEEPKMNHYNVETKVFIGGIEASTLTDDQIFAAISELEKEIDSLGKIRATSTKLADKKKSLDDNIKELVAYLDSRK